jgi:hypothetical protein
MTTTYVETKWIVRVTQIDNTTEREYRRVVCEASPPNGGVGFGDDEDVCRLAYDFRERFEKDTTREGITYEVEILRTEVSTSTQKGMRECEHHASIMDPEYGCRICADIKLDPDWETKYPELAGKI